MKLFKASIFFFGLLFILGLAYTIYQTPERNFENACQVAQSNLNTFEKSVFAFSEEEVELWASGSISTAFLKELSEENYSVYLYENDSLVFWNKNNTIPELAPKNIAESGELLINKSGFYVGFRRTIGKYHLVGLQLIKRNFPIVNSYLCNEFTSSYPFDEGVSLQSAASDSSATCSLLNSHKQAILHLENTGSITPQTSSFGIFMGVLSVVSFWIVAWMLISYFNKYHPAWTSYLILIFASVLFIELLGFVNFEFKKTILFSPELYASQYFGPSLGHLFFNSIVLLFINLLIGLQYYLKQWRLNQVGFFFFSAWLSVQILLYNAVLQSLILDSIISFEINNFTLTTLYTFLGLFIISGLSIGLFVSLYIWLHTLLSRYSKQKFVLLLGFFFLNSVILYVFQFEFMGIVLPLTLFIHSMVFYLLMQKSVYSNRFKYIANALFFAALIIASALSYYNAQNENSRKEIAANQLSKNRDLITEYRFEEIQSEIKEDPFFRKFFISPFVSQKELQQRLNYLYFGGYLSKYNVSCTAFNIEGKPIKTNKSIQLNYYYRLINQEAEDTYSEWLFLVPQKDGKNTYLSILPIENNGKVSGTLVLELNQKTYTKENLYPELLIEQKTSPIAQLKTSKDYEYAVYKSDFLVNQAGEYPFPYNFNSFEAEGNYPLLMNAGSFKLNLFKIDEETKVVIASKRSSFLIPISTFSYVISYLVVLSLLAAVLIFFLSKHSDILPLKPIQFTFKNKINTSVALITIASFFIIGLVTISYFSGLYRENHTNELIKKQQTVLTSLEYYFDREDNAAEAALSTSLSTELVSMAEIQGIDINLFDLDGSLMLSSQPGVFGNGLISNKINPLALHHILSLKDERYIQDEKIGSLSYQSVYVPVRLNNGQPIAILNLPYFAQEETLRKELSNLMVALVNVYVLLLMISILVAFLISTSITRPLASIGEKIGLVKVDSKNEQIAWESDDEIGALVKEYNKMIVQIEESAHALAQSERESAWREMARQIAHEIKNPLTPMKLGIQHLQRAIQDNPDEVKGLVEKVSKMMIEQIENLSEIATAFSSFAKMPKATKEKVNLIEVLQNVLHLFNQTSKTPIELSSSIEEAWVYADKNQLLSVFNNLVKNAQQATENLDEPSVVIQLKSADKSFEVQVIDNGVGIPADKLNKVFVPNFTTKSSGTGLGLAISKQIIENSQGKIWFESEENKGSTFFVTLPKYKKFN